jgi:voltage-gated potassium channel
VDERAARVEHRFEVPLLIAAALVIPAIVIEESVHGGALRSVGSILNWTIWLAFLAELVVMLSVVRSRWEWIKSHPLDVVIVLFTGPFVPAAWQSARLLRLLRLLRLVKLVKYARRVFSLAGLRFAAFLAALTALGGGAAFAEAEHQTTWHGIYWAITTMTTVGYGDFQPTKDVTEVIAVVVMLVGIGFVAILTGAIAQRFLTTEVAEVGEGIAELESDEEALMAQVRALALQVQGLEVVLERHMRTREAE